MDEIKKISSLVDKVLLQTEKQDDKWNSDLLRVIETTDARIEKSLAQMVARGEVVDAKIEKSDALWKQSCDAYSKRHEDLQKSMDSQLKTTETYIKWVIGGAASIVLGAMLHLHYSDNATKEKLEQYQTQTNDNFKVVNDNINSIRTDIKLILERKR